MTYCEYVRLNPQDELHKVYHDTQYGFPHTDDNALFERLVLEINQAGLSWITILKKAANFHQAYDGFDVDRVAGYSEADRARLLANAGIIRNRLKVDAAIENARRIQRLRGEFGSFVDWLDAQGTLGRDDWTRLFKKTFVFTGGEIVNEFLTSTGYLAGAHEEDCPVFGVVALQGPPWQRART
jgi:DNA-3-methyladenine glycosylase I